jgi:hypothetical protein
VVLYNRYEALPHVSGEKTQPNIECRDAPYESFFQKFVEGRNEFEKTKKTGLILASWLVENKYRIYSY